MDARQRAAGIGREGRKRSVKFEAIGRYRRPIIEWPCRGQKRNRTVEASQGVRAVTVA